MGGIGNQSNSIDNTRNFLLPDGTGRRILDIPISERKPFILDNGHSVYQIHLEDLEPILETSTYLIDRLTGQLHAVYDDGYSQMATMPMIWSTWQEGQLVAKLNNTCTHFGLPPTGTPVKKPTYDFILPIIVPLFNIAGGKCLHFLFLCTSSFNKHSFFVCRIFWKVS